jgi:hypothetical protein
MRRPLRRHGHPAPNDTTGQPFPADPAVAAAVDAAAEDCPLQHHYQLLEQASADNPWRELADEFCGDPEQFHERHYSEFVTFLPYVQRFLYGEGGGDEGASPLWRIADPHLPPPRRGARCA